MTAEKTTLTNEQVDGLIAWYEQSMQIEARSDANLNSFEPNYDPENPLHQKFKKMVDDAKAEAGVKEPIDLIFLPERNGENELALNSIATFFAGFDSETDKPYVIIPEIADYLFTDNESRAVLSHEINHITRRDLLKDKASALAVNRQYYADYKEAVETGATQEDIDNSKQALALSVIRTSQAATRSEVVADEATIDQGRASDMIAALQKIMIACIPETPGKHPDEEIAVFTRADTSPATGDMLDFVDEERMDNYCSSKQASVVHHTSETFTARLTRLREADEKQEKSGFER